jgi:hypothetical protein
MLSFLPPPLSFLLFLPPVFANVEIINFHHSSSPTTSHLPHLTRLQPSLRFNLTPLHSLTVAIDTTDWSSGDAFTLRASWSAAYPFDVSVQFDDSGLANLTAVQYGVPVPGKQAPTSLPVVLILEHLYWGFLPTSILPTLAFLVAVCGISASWVAPRLHAHALKHLEFKSD